MRPPFLSARDTMTLNENVAKAIGKYLLHIDKSINVAHTEIDDLVASIKVFPESKQLLAKDYIRKQLNVCKLAQTKVANAVDYAINAMNKIKV
jgi:hypothetical protein